MNKLFLLATIVALVFADGTIHQLGTNDFFDGTLVLDTFARFYIDYPENTSQIAITLTATEIAGSDCTSVYIAFSTISYPCLDEPTDDLLPPNYDNDPCSSYDYSYTDASSTGESETFYVFPGSYDSSIFDESQFTQTGRLFISVNREYSTDNCAFKIATDTSSCPSALGANNGIAIAQFEDDLVNEDSYSLKCDVYTNITLVAGTPVYTQIANFSTAQGEIIYKTFIPKNAAYVNFTLNGTVYFTDEYSEITLIASSLVATNETEGYFTCDTYLDDFDDTTHYQTVSLNCQNVPYGPMYITIVYDSEEDYTTSFHGTLASTLVTCADGTALGYYESDSDSLGNYDQSLNCSSAYYFNASSLFNPLVGNYNFTNVPTGTFQTGYFDFPASLVGGGVTLNFTGCGSAANCNAYLLVGLYLAAAATDTQVFRTDDALSGFSLSPYSTDATGFFNITQQRMYVSYYCDEGPCTSTIFVSGISIPTPPPSPPSASTTTASGTTTATGTTTASTSTGKTSTTTATGTTGNTTITGNKTTTAKASTTASASAADAILPSLAIVFATLIAALI